MKLTPLNWNRNATIIQDSIVCVSGWVLNKKARKEKKWKVRKERKQVLETTRSARAKCDREKLVWQLGKPLEHGARNTSDFSRQIYGALALLCLFLSADAKTAYIFISISVLLYLFSFFEYNTHSDLTFAFFWNISWMCLVKIWCSSHAFLQIHLNLLQSIQWKHDEHLVWEKKKQCVFFASFKHL